MSEGIEQPNGPESEPGEAELFNVEDLHRLRELSYGDGNNRETAVRVVEISTEGGVEKVEKTFELGEEARVKTLFGPRQMRGVAGMRRQTIGFHVHPDVRRNVELAEKHGIDLDRYSEVGSPSEMLPSTYESFHQSQILGGGGDLSSSIPAGSRAADPMWFERDPSKSPGGINLVTKDGVTMFVGSGPMSLKTRRKVGLMGRVVNVDKRFRPRWSIVHGSNAGELGKGVREFSDKMEASNTGLNLLAGEGVGVVQLDYFAAEREMHFVMLSWEVFDKLVEQSGGLHEVVFGNGLSKLVKLLQEEHGVGDILVAESLAQALTEPVFPVRRQRKTREAQSEVVRLLKANEWEEQDWTAVEKILSMFAKGCGMRNGVELRALCFKMGGQLPWPNSIRGSLRAILKERETGAEFIQTLRERENWERHIQDGINYFERLPDYFFDLMAERAVAGYLSSPDEVVGVYENTRRPKFEDDYVGMLIILLLNSDNRLQEYLKDWKEGGEREKNFAEWIETYNDAVNWPI